MMIKKMIYDGIEKREVLYTDIYRNYRFYIVSYGTHPCVYIEIPKTHKFAYENTELIPLNVHGGITYSEDYLNCDNVPNNDNYFIGWDYAHYLDYTAFKYGQTDGIKRTTEELIIDAKDAIDELINLD